MTTTQRLGKKPFMISREDGDGNDFAVVHQGLKTFKRWADWDGSKFADRETAQWFIDNCPPLKGATVIEILEEVRYRS